MNATPLILTLVLLIASGFFVASEFALVAARRHRIEQAAEDGKRGARAALNGLQETSLMLAGAQLGITMVVVGLGMVSEPAFHHMLEPVMSALGVPHAVANTLALLVALVVITFLHVVVGEMAPKSWAISHPERSAMLLAPAFRTFTWLVRWLLVALNGMTNTLLRLLRVPPPDDVAHVRNRQQIHHLVDESRKLGLIGDGDHGLLSRTLGAPDTPVRNVMVPASDIAEVPASAGPDEVIATVQRTGRTRLVVRDEDRQIVGSVHVREALVARGRGAAWTAGHEATPIPDVADSVDLPHAAELLRTARAQLGLVRGGAGQILGLVSMDDLATKILMNS